MLNTTVLIQISAQAFSRLAKVLRWRVVMCGILTILVAPALISEGVGDLSERFWVGAIGEQPVLLLHEVETPIADGWQVRSHLQVRVTLPGGAEVVVDQVVVTEESDQGQLLRFTSVEQDRESGETMVTGEVISENNGWALRVDSGDGSAPHLIPAEPGMSAPWGPRGQRLNIAQRFHDEQGDGVWTGMQVQVQAGQPTLVRETLRRLAMVPVGWQVEAGPTGQSRTITMGADGALAGMEMVMLGQTVQVHRVAEMVVLPGSTLSPQLLIPGRRPGRRLENTFSFSAAVLAGVAASPFQQVNPDGSVVVCAMAEPGIEAERARDPGLLAAAAGIEADDPELSAWIDAAFQPDYRRTDPGTIAHYAEALARSRLGFAPHPEGDQSAKQAWLAQRGDCSEHARLLTAILRHLSIPSEPVFGVVYDQAAAGWRAHAWVTYFDREQNRWRHADSALLGVPRSCYLAVAVPPDDPTAAWRALARWLPVLREEGIR